jgi:hypothetical protein
VNKVIHQEERIEEEIDDERITKDWSESFEFGEEEDLFIVFT